MFKPLERVRLEEGTEVEVYPRAGAGRERWKAQTPPWKTCEAALSEAFHLLGDQGASPLQGLLRRRAAVVNFDLAANPEAVLKLMEKYSNVPASLADASLVRMTETIETPILLTTDSDFETLGAMVVR